MLKYGGNQGRAERSGWREARVCSTAEAKEWVFKGKGMINSVTCCLEVNQHIFMEHLLRTRLDTEWNTEWHKTPCNNDL